jgi:hypothetical protein
MVQISMLPPESGVHKDEGNRIVRQEREPMPPLKFGKCSILFCDHQEYIHPFGLSNHLGNAIEQLHTWFMLNFTDTKDFIILSVCVVILYQ